MPRNCAGVFNVRPDWRFRRCFERSAAAACPARVRIHELKAGSGQSVAKIERRAAQEGSALVIDEKLDTVALDNVVAGLLFVERHFIMQTRTTALGDLHAQTFPGRLLLLFEQTYAAARAAFWVTSIMEIYSKVRCASFQVNLTQRLATTIVCSGNRTSKHLNIDYVHEPHPFIARNRGQPGRRGRSG